MGWACRFHWDVGDAMEATSESPVESEPTIVSMPANVTVPIPLKPVASSPLFSSQAARRPAQGTEVQDVVAALAGHRHARGDAATTNRSDPLPPTRFSKPLNDRLLPLVYCPLAPTCQMAAAFRPVSVSILAPPTSASMLSETAADRESVPVRPSMAPTAVSCTCRDEL